MARKSASPAPAQVDTSSAASATTPPEAAPRTPAGERALEVARAKTLGLKTVSKGVQADNPSTVVTETPNDLEDRLHALAHTLHAPPLLPHVLSDLREVTPTLGVDFSKSHKEFYNYNVAGMTQLGTIVSQRHHERRTRVWVGGMNAVAQLADRTSTLAMQFSNKRAVLIWCGGQKPLGTGRRKNDGARSRQGRILGEQMVLFPR